MAIHLNEKIGEFPIKLRKLIKITKILLDKPAVIFIDQKALEFTDQKYDEILGIMQEVCSKSTFIVILSCFSKVLCMDKLILMKNGEIFEQGETKMLLKNKNSKVSQFIKKHDYKVFKSLRTQEPIKEDPFSD